LAIINSEQVEVFNKQLSEKKGADPVLSGASPEALDIAIGQARREVIPKSFGAAMFEIPEGKDPNQYINSITDNIVSTAVGNFKDLSIQNPTYLSGWIQNKPSFKDSKAYNDLKTITKTEFDTIENGISDLESGESADFRNKELNKISSNNLQHVLDSTVLNYLKEIGIQRATGAAPSDGYILESAKEVFDFLAKSLTPPPPKPQEAPPPPPPAKVEQTPPQAPPVEIPATVTTSQPEITKPVAAATETPAATPVATPPVTPVATPPAPEQKPSIVQQTQTNVTNITNQAAAEAGPKTFGAGTTKEFTKEESPLLTMLGDQLGMNAGEIANMFAGADIETFDQVIAQSFGGETSNLTQQADEILQNPDLAAKASTVVEGIAQSENIPPTVKEQVANVVSQKTQINEPVPPAPAPPQEQTPPPPPPQTPPASQEANQEKSQETKAQEEKEKSSSEAETKAAEESKKEEDQKINGELLKTMREILKVLQGPLIVTDNTHKFS
jgi:hypothetical protein